VRFRVNAPKVISETIDGEAVVINLDTGNYYSLEGSAGEIWGLLEQGLGTEKIESVLTSRHRASSDEVSTILGNFLKEVQADDLLVPVADHQAGPEPTVEVPPPGESQLLAPHIAKYTDLKHLIALDPIHDVDLAAGWPRPG
jgi:hypothetical protein